MDIRTLFQNNKKSCTVKSPWVIEEIANGLKARSVKFRNGIYVKKNKKIPVQYFENDRIFGRGVFVDDGILKVMKMFDELKNITPLTIGYIFGDNIYLNYNKGILKRSDKTGEENFYSEGTLQNEHMAHYLELSCITDPTYERKDTDRVALHGYNPELETITD